QNKATHQEPDREGYHQHDARPDPLPGLVRQSAKCLHGFPIQDHTKTPARCGRRGRHFDVRWSVLILSVLLAGCLVAEDLSAWELYEFGREAEKKGHMAQAYLLYSKAATLEPRNQTYWLRSQAVRSRAALEAQPVP